MRDDKRYDHHDPKGHPEHRPDPEQEKKDKKKKKRRRKRRLIRWIILLLILIGIVLGILYGGKLGLGNGFGFLPGVSADKDGGTQGGEDEKSPQTDEKQPTSVATITPEPTQEAEGGLVPDAYITVSEDKIYLNSTELSADGLKAQLENAYKGAKVILTDDYAIKDSYESVKDLLETLGITEYEEKKEQ